MEITEKELIQIISEEIDKMVENDDIDEGVLDQLKAKASGALSSAGSAIASKVPGGEAAAAEMATNAKLKQASSIMKSYAKHMQKLKLKLDADVTKLGIGDIDDIKKVSQSIEQSRALTQDTADNAPRSEKFRKAVQAAAAQQTGQQPAAEPAAAGEPAAAPAAAAPAATPAATPAAAPAATPAAAPAAAPAATPASAPAAQPASGQRQPSQSPRNVRRRARRAAETPDQRDARLARRRQRDATRRAASRQAASTRPAAAANSAVNESKVKKGETLSEQLQKISERWGFGK